MELILEVKEMVVEDDRQHVSQSLNAWRFVSMSSINLLFMMNFMNGIY